MLKLLKGKEYTLLQHSTNKYDYNINIEGLPKERVVIALFKNVFKKSEASYDTWMKIADLCYFDGKAPPVGTQITPDKMDVKEILAKQQFYIEYIGAVYFGMDFSSNTIISKSYDQIHQTHSNSNIETAKQCIQNLRKTIELEKTNEKGKDIFLLRTDSDTRLKTQPHFYGFHSLSATLDNQPPKKEIDIIETLLNILEINNSSDLRPKFHDHVFSCSIEFPKSMDCQKMNGFAQILAIKDLDCEIEEPYDFGFISSGYRLKLKKSKKELEEWFNTMAAKNSEETLGLVL